MAEWVETSERSALSDLYALLEHRGVTFYAADDEIQLDGPPWAITTALCAVVEHYRDELLEEVLEGWACALCGTEGAEIRSDEHPEWCEECTDWRCRRCCYDDPEDRNPDHPDLCSWCAKQWDDD
jgi:hypothetical protein